MLSTGYFYHNTFEKFTTAFLDIFNEIDIKRYNADDSVLKTIRVPIAFSPRHKWLSRLQEDYQKNSINIQTTLPRMSCNFGDPVYDQERMLNKSGRKVKEDTLGQLKRLFNPIPYNIPFTLSVWCQNLTDSLQIVEQVMATFAPEINMRVIDIPEINLCTDVPVILENITKNDDFEGDFSDFRMIEWELSFNIKGYVYPILTDTSVIKKVNSILKDINTDMTYETLTSAVNPLSANKDDVYTIDDTITVNPLA